jgi:hypothetical protein
VKPYQVSNEMMWIQDANITAARQHDGWRQFHRAAGSEGLFFDNPVRDGKRGPYTCVAFVVKDYKQYEVGRGRAATVIEAVVAAYRDAGRTVENIEHWIGVLLDQHSNAPIPVADDSFDSLLDPDSFEALLK